MCTEAVRYLSCGLLRLVSNLKQEFQRVKVPVCEERPANNETRQASSLSRRRESLSVADKRPLDCRHLQPGVERTEKKMSSWGETLQSVGKGKTAGWSGQLLGHLVSINYISNS